MTILFSLQVEVHFTDYKEFLIIHNSISLSIVSLLNQITSINEDVFK